MLLTRIELRWMRWLLRPEAVSTFSCDEELREALRASCHIPVLGGLWPYAVHRSDGSHRGSYFDGLFWPSVLYMWRAFDSSDALLKVSGIGWPTSHIHLPVPTPPHWILLPPSKTTLWRLYAQGYDDTAHFFSQRAARDRLFPRRSAQNGSSPSTSGLPSPSELPAAPRRRDRMLQLRIVIGWMHLTLLTLLFPFVPPYLAVRDALRPLSSAEIERGPTRSDHPVDGVRFVLRWARRGFVACLLLVLWPFALIVVGLRVLWPFEARPLPVADPQSPPTSRDLSPPMSPLLRPQVPGEGGWAVPMAEDDRAFARAAGLRSRSARASKIQDGEQSSAEVRASKEG